MSTESLLLLSLIAESVKLPFRKQSGLSGSSIDKLSLHQQQS